MERTFLLGVGAMKAGTTWLHDHLAASPQCDPGVRKEYHVFDSLDLEQERFMLGRVVDRARASLDVVAEGRPTDPTFLLQTAMVADEQLYYDHFTALFARDPRTRLTMDITPAYALLSAQRLATVRAEFERRGVRAVAAFLLRDPVERIWSQVRMQKRRRPAQNPEPAEELVAQRFADASYADRTRYEHTLTALDASFAEAYVGFYEELFDPARSGPELGRLSALLGIEPHAPDLDASFNVSPRTAALPEATVRAVAEHFRATYESVAARFPDRDLRTIWPSSRFVL
ncbi:sulfotransferase [Nocardioides anomalus]|uniref:Sulfotransferase n=1 Tax=Nocardioides anomalus TaxID=2712223 RepID=A0A6G6WI96_9ACTN|nr:sulfotransferase [Nocardioides anomalus]QIG44815.1 sulfotransferase [Nocardioides anomalus]